MQSSWGLKEMSLRLRTPRPTWWPSTVSLGLILWEDLESVGRFISYFNFWKSSLSKRWLSFLCATSFLSLWSRETRVLFIVKWLFSSRRASGLRSFAPRRCYQTFAPDEEPHQSQRQLSLVSGPAVRGRQELCPSLLLFPMASPRGQGHTVRSWG